MKTSNKIDDELLDTGERLYDAFLKKVFRQKDRLKIPVPNPRTNTLELFAVLSQRKEQEWLIGAMCAEIASSCENGEIFAQKGRLFRRITQIKEVPYEND